MRVPPRILRLASAGLGSLALTLVIGAAPAAAAPCDAPITNPVACENTKPGNPASEWDVSGAGSSTIQGFATDISVDQGQTIGFKVDTPSTNYRLDIYRMGYYGGLGARKVATVLPVALLPQTQPACQTTAATGLVDCGNWAVSANWIVPGDAVSGIYFAQLVRQDGTAGASHVMFVVRDDDGRSDVLFQTSDTTWQAYNRYGGNSLYTGNPAGRAYKVSYNRPFTTRDYAPEDWVFNAEYPMVRFLERNGYNLSYTTGIDADRRGAEILEHRSYLSVGHDEYWSGDQRANVEAARAAGVHLGFFSGNEVFWKTRYENGHRTLVTYKETHANAKIDPTSAWTGTWRDPRFSPPADGNRPENGLTGQLFMVNDGATTAIRVPAADGKMRFWRNTNVATQAAGATATLGANTLGYEWDTDPDNGSRPGGSFRLSSTTVANAPVLIDHGSTFGSDTAEHNLTLYRGAGGGLVFGAGTVQWAWGLDSSHDRGSGAADTRMQQGTINLLADMGTQPATLMAGMTAATPSADATAPSSTITAPAAGGTVSPGATVNVTGTATDSGGQVGGVEVSIDGGTTWHPATGRASWSYSFRAGASGSLTIRSRAVDDTANRETPSAGVTVTIGSGNQSCPCSIWGTSATPARAAETSDTGPLEVGVKFRSSAAGRITGVRFYKGATNTGTHVGHLWTGTGTLLATATFTNETATGWQEVAFSSPVTITAGTTYVASYYAPRGNYAVNEDYFANGGGVDSPPLRALSDGEDGGNGVYGYGALGTFPNGTYRSENYWVDVLYEPSGADTTAPTVTGVAPASGATSVSASANATATFSEAMSAASITTTNFELRGPGGTLVPAAVSYDAASRTATLNPTAALAASTAYTATVKGGATGVKDLAGNALATDRTWTFTTAASGGGGLGCPCSIWGTSAVPAHAAETGDSGPLEVGVKFRAQIDGNITGVRFYKGATNTGTHVGHLWTRTGTLLASATFTSETATGWQEVSFSSPVSITAGTTYVASYYAPRGNYAYDSNYFAGRAVDNAPLRALADGEDGGNGVYGYGALGTFPNGSYQTENYWVDVVFENDGPDTSPPRVTGVLPARDGTGVNPAVNVSATFNETMTASTIGASTFTLRDAGGNPVAAGVSYDAATRTATLDPTAELAEATTYTATVKGGASGVKDSAGNALASDDSWNFSTASPPGPPPDEGPGGPVLVLSRSTAPFSRYYAEILRTEGLNEFTVKDISTVTAATLGAYDVVIVGDFALTTAQVTMLTTWVDGGGDLVAMRPDKQLASLFGLTDAGATLSDAYLRIDTSQPPGTGLVGETMQFHGAADRYTLNGATGVATLYSSASAATSAPAVTTRAVGGSGGSASAFTFDLARSIVYTRQGNPAWNGQERDGQAPIRSDDLFFGGAQADWVDRSKIAIPQADEQQRLLANLVGRVTADKKPLPRFWYLPRGLKAAVVMTGDDHAGGGTAGRFDAYKAASPAGCSVANWECIRSSSYIYTNTALSNAAAAGYHADGFEVGIHVNTNCADWTPASLEDFYTSQLTGWTAKYTSLPASVSTRIHCIAWSDWASAAKVQLGHGIRLDGNYYYWPPAWVNDAPGFFTGSGMLMRFADLDGTMIDAYQSATQMTDESGQTFPFTINTLLDRALGATGYYGIFNANMHTDTVAHAASDAIVASAKARGVPVVSGRQMLTWLDGRNASSFGSMSWSNNALSFRVTAGNGANGLRAMLPASFGGRTLQTLTRDGTAVATTQETIKGVAYAFFPATTGNYVATYAADTAAPTISAVAATAAAAGTTATVTWTTNEASDSRVTYGTAPDALNQTASNAASVTSHSVPLSGLAQGTRYYYRVHSADAAGNSTTAPATASAPAEFVTPRTQFPATTTIETGMGTLRGGTAAALTADDNSFYEVNSTTSGTRTSSWYGSFTGVPSTLANLRVTYRGKNSRSCTQTVAIWNWTTSAWVQLDSRAVGTAEVTIADLAPTGTLGNYRSGTGEVRVRVRSTPTANANFFSSGELMQIGYTP